MLTNATGTAGPEAPLANSIAAFTAFLIEVVLASADEITTVEFATAWAAEGSKAATVVARIAINDAISAAAGTAGPAIPVQLQAGQYVTSAKYSYATPVS